MTRVQLFGSTSLSDTNMVGSNAATCGHLKLCLSFSSLSLFSPTPHFFLLILYQVTVFFFFFFLLSHLLLCFFFILFTTLCPLNHSKLIHYRFCDLNLLLFVFLSFSFFNKSPSLIYVYQVLPCL